MSKFNVIELEKSAYDTCVIVQTHESLYELKNELTPLITMLHSNNKILFDTLFHSGNSTDRFIEFEINDGEIDWETAQVARITKQDSLRSIIANRIKGDVELINNSILSSIQKKMIAKGMGI